MLNNRKIKAIGLKNRIFMPVLLTLFVLLGVFMLNTYVVQQKEYYEIGEKKIETVQNLLDSKVTEDAGMMSATLKIIVRDEKLQSAMRAGDRQALLELAAPLFEQLRAEHKITHFYFHDSNGTNLLRVHNPQRHGDRIERFTMQQAAGGGMESYGVELGPLGTFTLRVVTPWRVEGDIIGYIELGEEIDHIMQGLHEILNVEYVVEIDKKYLKQEDWAAGMSLLGRTGVWDQFVSTVIVASSTDALPDGLPKHYSSEVGPRSIGDRELQIKERRYYTNDIQLMDAGDRDIGHMTVLVDMTEILGTHSASMLIHLFIYSLVGMAALVFIGRLLGRVERELARANEQTRLEIEERTRAQDEVRRVNEALEDTVELRTTELRREIQTRREVERELRRQATTDRLTQAYNRAKFDDLIEHEIERAERYGQLLSVVLFDIDDFKAVNDGHGHTAGDHVLKSIAELIMRNKRGVDSLIRWGGEEFLVVAPGTDAAGVWVLAERIRKTVEGHSFDSAIRVTVSLGAAQLSEGDTADSLVRRADDAMYRAKAAGKNRLVMDTMV